MAFVVEDGTGLAGANSFASVAEFDNHLAGQLYAEDAAAATTDNKQRALMMASRLIDATVLWNGVRKAQAQGLGWPRYYAEEAEIQFRGFNAWTVWGSGYRYYDSNSVPKGVKAATCELARELLKTDRTAEPGEKGIKSTTVGPISVTFDATDRPAILTKVVRLMLRPFGSVPGSSLRFATVRRV